MIPRYLKEGQKVYFISYTSGTPQIKLGYVTEDFTGYKFIVYDYQWADNGEYYICAEEDIEKPETKIKIKNLLQKIKTESEDN